MGYYTDFTLTVSMYKTDNNFYKTETIPYLTLVQLEDEIKKMNVFDDNCDSYSAYYANAKWYDWESDMCILSKRFPELLFYLHGVGEEIDDMWDAYFLDGKFQYCPCIITYDDFNPSKLISSKKTENTCDEVYSYQL